MAETPEETAPQTETPAAEEHTEDTGSRRKFLGMAAVIGGAMGAMLGYPVGRIVAAPLFETVRHEDKWIPIGPTSDFGDERKEVEYSFEHQDGWYRAQRSRRVVVGKEDGGWVAISTECTHVGCGVNWDPEKKQFHCPCHDGVFRADGTVVSGPPPRPLTRLRVRERDGQLEVLEA